MPDAAWLAAALFAALLGMGWLALDMDAHWRQVHPGARRAPGGQIALRLLGALALTMSLMLCLAADTATMAVLVWMMLLALAATVVAFTLTWCPRALALAWRAARSE